MESQKIKKKVPEKMLTSNSLDRLGVKIEFCNADLMHCSFHKFYLLISLYLVSGDK